MTMHPYSSLDAGRWRVPFALAIVSVAAAYATGRLLTLVRLDLWWFDAPSVLGYYGILRGLFERYLWRCRTSRVLGLVETPDLSGEWKVTLRSSHDDHATELVCSALVVQTWTRFSLRLETDTSLSHSCAATILLDDAGGVLCYHYRNEPRSGSVETMAAHLGAAELRISRDGRSLDGEYFSGRGRRSYGRLRFERKMTSKEA